MSLHIYDYLRLSIANISRRLRDLELGGGSGAGTVTVAFTPSIPFDHSVTVVTGTTVNSNIVFTPNTATAVAGCSAMVRLTGNGVNNPDFSAFKLRGSKLFDNTNGRINSTLFIYDGVDYWVAFDTPTAIKGIDSTAPTVTTRRTAGTTTIEILFSEAVTSTTAGWSFKKNGSNLAISSVSGSSTTTLAFTVAAMSNGDTLLCSYDSTTGNCMDPSANKLVSFTDQSVTNLISSGWTVASAPWESRFDTDADVSGGPSLVDDGSGKATRIRDLIHVGFTSHDFVQSTSGAMPTIVTSGINGKKSILVDSGKWITQGLTTNTGPITHVVVLQPKVALTAWGYLFVGANGQLDFGHGSGVGFGGGAKPFLYVAGTGGFTYGSVDLVVNQTYVILITKSAASDHYKMWVTDLSVVNSSMSGSTVYEGLRLGHPTDGSPCWIREGGVIFQEASDANAVSLIADYKSRNAL